MSAYDVTTGKVFLLQDYTADFSDFTDPFLSTSKAYVDYKRSTQNSVGDQSLLDVVSSIVGVTGSSTYLAYEEKLDTIKEIADKIAENHVDAVDILNLLTGEISRGQSAESGISSSLLTEKTRAISGETSVSTRNDQETTRAIISANTLIALTNSETSRASGIQTGLSLGISAELARASAFESSLSASITAEYQTLQSSSTTELTLRSTGDTFTNTSVLNEQSLRVAGDTSYNTSLSSQITNRSNAVTTEQTAMLAKDTIISLSQSNFQNKTNTTLTGVTYDNTNNRYIFNSNVNETGHYLYLGTKWRLYGSEKSTIFQILNGTIWKNIVVFNKT